MHKNNKYQTVNNMGVMNREQKDKINKIPLICLPNESYFTDSRKNMNTHTGHSNRDNHSVHNNRTNKTMAKQGKRTPFKLNLRKHASLPSLAP